MALINFDCPECGHNLEVDEGGAGFIVKCPECGNPLQIPELPKSRRYRKIAGAAATFLAIALLFAINLFLWSRARNLEKQVAELAPLNDALQQAQAMALAQDAEIGRLQKQIAEVKLPDVDALAQAALAAIGEAEALAREFFARQRFEFVQSGVQEGRTPGNFPAGFGQRLDDPRSSVARGITGPAKRPHTPARRGEERLRSRTKVQVGPQIHQQQPIISMSMRSGIPE